VALSKLQFFRATGGHPKNSRAMSIIKDFIDLYYNINIDDKNSQRSEV
jgi:hypothetical protein